MKYLITLFVLVLVTVDAQDVRGKIACEGRSIQLNCGAGEYLEIVGGNFGRTSGDVCKYQKNNNCVSGWSLWHMKNKCNEKQTCSLSATTSEMGDPCPYTLKYLETYYRCVKELKCKDTEYKCKERKCISKQQVCDGLKDCAGGEDEAGCKYTIQYACENSELFISCKPGELIRIIKGFWGRNDKVTCGDSNVTNCASSTIDEYLKNKCNYSRSCQVPAMTSNLGDPCFGTIKYLQVQYSCWTIPRMMAFLLNEK